MVVTSAGVGYEERENNVCDVASESTGKDGSKRRKIRQRQLVGVGGIGEIKSTNWRVVGGRSLMCGFDDDFDGEI